MPDYENIQDNNYIYPDAGEALTISLIGETEPYPGYWEASETGVLDRAIKIIKKKYQNGTFLDVGCGFGRLILKFSPHFQTICGLEPDKGRYEVCRKNINNWGLAEKVKLLNGSVELLQEHNAYDVILCSHVIQHIPENTANTLLKEFRKLLKKDGLLVLTTSHSKSNKDIYYKSYFNSENKRVEEAISKSEFNITENTSGILPIKMYTSESLMHLLQKNKFHVDEIRVYHDDRGFMLIDKLIGTDTLANSFSGLKNKRGRDICVIAR